MHLHGGRKGGSEGGKEGERVRKSVCVNNNLYNEVSKRQKYPEVIHLYQQRSKIVPIQ